MKCFSILILFVLWIGCQHSGLNPVVVERTLTFEGVEDKIYLSARAWGLAGNNEKIILSTSPINNNQYSHDKDNYHVFHSPYIYYKVEGRKLIIYTNMSSYSNPSNFKSNVKIVLHDLKTAKELEEYRMNFEKYGLKRIGAI